MNHGFRTICQRHAQRQLSCEWRKVWKHAPGMRYGSLQRCCSGRRGEGRGGQHRAHHRGSELRVTSSVRWRDKARHNEMENGRRKTHASGTITAQSQPNIRQPMGMASVVRTTMTAQQARLMTRASQKRFRILGTSSQKFERSTSFLVAPHVML